MFFVGHNGMSLHQSSLDFTLWLSRCACGSRFNLPRSREEVVRLVVTAYVVDNTTTLAIRPKADCCSLSPLMCLIGHIFSLGERTGIVNDVSCMVSLGYSHRPGVFNAIPYCHDLNKSRKF